MQIFPRRHAAAVDIRQAKEEGALSNYTKSAACSIKHKCWNSIKLEDKSKLFTAIEEVNRTMMLTMMELNVLILEGTSGGSSSS